LHQWLIPVIPATQEAEIRRIMITIICDTLSQKKITKKGRRDGSSGKNAYLANLRP
jgi:hypothetical protein